jgi:hypothetical protein
MRPSPDTPDEELEMATSPGIKVVTALAIAAAVTVGAVMALTAGGDDDPATSAPSTTEGTTEPTDAPDTSSTTTADESPCGVTLAEVQALLPATSGVTESSTPDPGRCNFTWDDGGPRGIDVAIVPGGRAAFDVPAGYSPLDGYGDEAFASFSAGRASAFAFVGDDLYAADAVADGTGATEADLRALCLQLLELSLD